MNRGVHVNGKWLSQAVTGTQRYANEIVKAIVAADRFDLVIHIPAGVQVPAWMHRDRVEVRQAPVSGVLFEQFYLPLATRRSLLLNFAGPAPLLKRRQLVTMHDATTFRYPRTFRPAFVAFYYLMYSLLGRTASQLVTVSQFSAAELADVLGVPAERFLVVPCAADALSAAEPLCPALDLNGNHYLVVGTQAQHKNLTAPVIALSKSGRSVVVVGVSDGQQVYSATEPLTGHALLAGRLSDAELVWLYRNSRALIFPSKYEGFGLPPLEAQVLRCPVVCSDAASMPEVCGDGALYFDPDDTGSLLGQLDRLESDPLLAEQLRRRGTLNAQRFSWDASAQKIIEWTAAFDAVCVYLP